MPGNMSLMTCKRMVRMKNSPGEAILIKRREHSMAAGYLFASAPRFSHRSEHCAPRRVMRHGHSHPRLPRDAPGLDSVLEVIDGADGADDTSLAIEPQPLPQAINT